MARRMYRLKKSPLAGRRNRAILFGVGAAAIIIIGFGFYTIFKKDPAASGGKVDIKLETGDRPIPKEDAIYVNADGGLSLRADRNPNSERLLLIPNQTKLTATQELDGWYQVTYNDKTGWISKQYTTAAAPAEDPNKGWGVFSSTSGYKIKYQPGWKAQDYGANETLKAASIVAFSNLELPTTIPAGSEFIAPVTVAVSTKTVEVANSDFAAIAGVQAEAISIGGIAATKYTYTSASSNTQMTAIVLTSSGKVIILSEGGGYADDLLKMATTFTIG
jgi:hypothetical protein